MRNHLFLPLVWVGLVALFATGCGGALSMSQRLVGEWVGRPETVVDRTVREWPVRAGGKEVSAETPEVADAIAKAPVSDLEAVAPEVLIKMKLGKLGKATLSLDGEQPLTGRWTLTPLDGRRAQLEIEVEAASEEAKAVRRRYDLEFFKEGEAFTLSEQSADRRFGRLVFRRSGDSGQPAAKPDGQPVEQPTDAEPVTTESTDADRSNS